MKIGGVLLAAGASSRIGSPKPLLDWFGTSFIRHIINVVNFSDLDHLIVVTGSRAKEVELEIVPNNKLTLIRNTDWEIGQSSSVIAGINCANQLKLDAVVFLLVDQPQVSGTHINQIIHTYKEMHYGIITTEIEGNLIPPVLFDRALFNHLLVLKGDEGARKIIHDHPYKTVTNKDKNLYLDVDTWEDYEKLIRNYNDCV